MLFTHLFCRRAALPLLVAGFAALAALPAHAQLVTNGGFENDNNGDSNYFTGWTLSGNADDASATPNSFVFGNPYSGDLAAWLGPVGTDGFLSQSIATTAGQAYTISYWLAVDGSGGQSAPNDFSATFGSHSLFSGANLPVTDTHLTSADDYVHYSYTAVASSSATTLKFGFRDDPAEFRLDDVSVAPAAIPEASTVLSFGLMLALGGLSITARRRKAAPPLPH